LKQQLVWRKRAAVKPGELAQILVVDDDVALLRIVREALTTCLRCQVDTSPRPEYGFELALKKRYDLFIFDFQMPMIDGAMLFFLIGKVYNNLQPPRIVPPLLLVSGKADEERAQELLKEPGVRGLIAKPFSINRLLQKAQECVPGMQAISAAPVEDKRAQG
jgi:CheY-like chemotaxis protein